MGEWQFDYVNRELGNIGNVSVLGRDGNPYAINHLLCTL